MKQPIDLLLEGLADQYAAARDQLQAHPQFSDYATLKDIPPDLKTLVVQYQTARQCLLEENIPVGSIIPARKQLLSLYSSLLCTAADPIALSDIILYDAAGKPMKIYQHLSLDGEAAKDQSGNYLSKTQDEWLAHWDERGRSLPSLPLWYAILEQLHERQHPGLAGIVKDLKENWLATSTRLNYKGNEVRHEYDGSGEYVLLPCSLPAGDHWLKDVAGRKEWKDSLQSLLLCTDVERAASVLQEAAGVPPYIWTASRGTRSARTERAAWLGASANRLYLNCIDGLIYGGRSRSVARA